MQNLADINPVFEKQEFSNDQGLSSKIKNSTQHYLLRYTEGEKLSVYDRVLADVEKPLLETVMNYTKQNQSHAARVLGLSRGTLRKKLKQYFGGFYVSSRSEESAES